MKAFQMLVVTALCCLLMSCTGTSTIGNGKVDPVEKATISLAVGMTLSAKPETILPAYAVSSAILAVVKADTVEVPIEKIDAIIAVEVDKLKLDALTRQSFNDLVELVKAKVVSMLPEVKVGEGPRVVVIREIVQIVHDSAAARLAVK